MIKVSAGLSRKVGGPNYSSRGGSVHFEQEFEAGAIHHPERLREGIDKLFALAREALEEELRAAGDQPKPAQHQHEEAARVLREQHQRETETNPPPPVNRHPCSTTMLVCEPQPRQDYSH